MTAGRPLAAGESAWFGISWLPGVVLTSADILNVNLERYYPVVETENSVWPEPPGLLQIDRGQILKIELRTEFPNFSMIWRTPKRF